MISWLLSKLFSVKTLVTALSYKKDVVSCDVIQSRDLEGMANMYQDLLPIREENNVVVH